jgi:hypothetical protein
LASCIELNKRVYPAEGGFRESTSVGVAFIIFKEEFMVMDKAKPLQALPILSHSKRFFVTASDYYFCLPRIRRKLPMRLTVGT